MMHDDSVRKIPLWYSVFPHKSWQIDFLTARNINDRTSLNSPAALCCQVGVFEIMVHRDGEEAPVSHCFPQ